MVALLQLTLTVSVLWLLYTYFGYPAILFFLAKRSPRKRRQSLEPTVTILTAAFNEEGVIAESIRNKLSLDYPLDKVEIIVISDDSTDATDRIVQEFESSYPHRVRLIRQAPRQGKTSALNRAIQEARGEILIFADANSLYETSALRHLVSNFANESVGYVTGRMVYTDPGGSVTADGCATYMRYENLLRSWETRIGSVIGVDGGIDAVRKSLYQTMRPDQLPDFVLPLRVVQQGYRVAYEPAAILREPALGSSGQEYRMRVRVVLRSLWALYDSRQLFNPLRDAKFSWQLISHKLLRYLAFIPQLLTFFSNALLVPEGVGFRLLFLGQVIFYFLAGAGYFAEKSRFRFPVLTLPYYFSLLNISCCHAFVKFLRGQKQVLWQPRAG